VLLFNAPKLGARWSGTLERFARRSAMNDLFMASAREMPDDPKLVSGKACKLQRMFGDGLEALS
jgi:hypothetical protein